MYQGATLINRSAAIVAALVLLAGCGGGGSSSTPPVTKPTTGPTATPTAAPTPTPLPTAAPQRLYTSALSTNGPISYFTAPFSASSLPTSSFAIAATGETGGLAIGPTGNVLVADAHLNTITSNSRPSPASSIQYVINTGFAPTGLAFGPTGTLFVADYSGAIATVSAPLSAASTVTPLIISGLTKPFGICFDAAGNLYVADSGTEAIDAYAPPYTGAPIVVTPNGNEALYGTAYDTVTNQLIVTQAGSNNGVALVYNLPLTSASTPAAAIDFSGGAPVGVAVDKSGNLYLGYLSATTSPNNIQVLSPPFVSATNPTPTLTFASPIVSNAAEPVFTMVFGS